MKDNKTLWTKIHDEIRSEFPNHPWYNREKLTDKIHEKVEDYYSWKTNLGSLIMWSIAFGILLAFIAWMA